MRAIIFNDTSRFHHGCAAVMRVLHRGLRQAGIGITESVYGNTYLMNKEPPVWSPEAWDSADLVVINGEGTMHDDSRMAQFLMGRIEEARGCKKIALVNSLWENMSPKFTDMLASVDLLVAREPHSAAAMRTSRVRTLPDLSFFEVPPTSTLRPTGAVLGTFYKQAHKDLVLDDAIDIRRQDWSTVVNRLRHADVLFTGKHHEVFAACVARCPFVVSNIKTHKVKALGAYVGADIPVVSPDADAGSVRQVLDEARSDNTGVFARLFDTLDALRVDDLGALFGSLE